MNSVKKEWENMSLLSERCKHSKIIKKEKVSNCFDCGIRLLDSPTLVFKSKTNDFQCIVSSLEVFKRMEEQSIWSISLKNRKFSEYMKNRNILVNWIFDMGERLNLSYNSRHLAIYFMDYLLDNEEISIQKLQFYGITSLMLSAKSIEKDERIPFISQIKKISGLGYKIDEFRKVESHILNILDWDLQKCTHYDYLKYYLAQGIVFSTDQIGNELLSSPIPIKIINKNENIENLSKEGLDSLIKIVEEICLGKDKQTKFELDSSISESGTTTPSRHDPSPKNSLLRMKPKKIIEMVRLLEKTCLSVANNIIKEISYYDFQPNILACLIIAYSRKKLEFQPIWTKELENLSFVSENYINEKFQIFKNIIEKQTPLKNEPSLINKLPQSISDTNYFAKKSLNTKSNQILTTEKELFGNSFTNNVLGEINNPFNKPIDIPAQRLVIKGNNNHQTFKNFRSASQYLILPKNINI